MGADSTQACGKPSPVRSWNQRNVCEPLPLPSIFIHGQPNDWPGADLGARVPGDWTDGCIALSNAEIEALWQAVPDGTPIEILP